MTGMIGKSKQTTAAGRSALTVILAITTIAALAAGCGKDGGGAKEASKKSGGATAKAAKPDTRWYTKSSEAQAFNISTADQLAGLAQLVNGGNNFSGKTIKLFADINLIPYGKETAFNGGKGWIPIDGFSGTFDGDYKSIRGLYINDASLPSAGLFGSVRGGAVKNVSVADAVIYGGDNVGGVAGRTDGKNITGCHSVGGTISGRDGVGGVVGAIYSETADTVMTNSYSTATVRGQKRVGGVVGAVLNGIVSACHNNGAVNGSDHIGGVAGSIGAGNGKQGGSSVTFSYSTGAITGQNFVGGVVGSASLTSYVTNCYSTGPVSGTENVGGVAGKLIAGSLSNCYSTSTVSGAKSVGGVVGASEGESVCLHKDCGSKDAYSYFGGKVVNSAALNPSVRCESAAGRIIGNAGKGIELKNNIAFSSLADKNGNTNKWVMNKANAGDGAGITAEIIAADGTIGGQFKNGWTTQNGRLPGLDGNTVIMPEHLTARNAFTDTRDGKMYRYVKIGNQVWMAENLNFKTGNSWCYDNDNSNCNKYGRLYDWNTAVKACPAGWRLPDIMDWNILAQSAGGERIEEPDDNNWWNFVGKKLKSKTGWNENGNGTDEFGFSALPGGFRRNDDNRFFSADSAGIWWSATGNGNAYNWNMGYHHEYVYEHNNDKTYGFSVRCVKDR